MNGIRMMIGFDFRSNRKSDLLIAAAAAAAGLLLALFISPQFTFLFCMLGAGLFLSPQSAVIRQPDFRKIYGVLPVERSAVTRAAFIESAGGAFLGELAGMVIFKISCALQIYVKLRAMLNNAVESDAAAVHSEIGTLMLTFAVTSLLLCYLRMMSDIFGTDNEVKIVMISLLALAVIIVPPLVLISSGKLAQPDLSFLSPEQFGGKLLVFCAVHLVIFGICALFCELTVRKLRGREM